MQMASRGDQSKVNMTVADIYGGGGDELVKHGLKGTLTASFFGKFKDGQRESVENEDLANALVTMVTQVCTGIERLPKAL